MKLMLICVAIFAVFLFAFAPGLIGAYDLSCWFLFDSQCTSIAWTENRKIWAIVPWVLTAAIALFGAMGV